MPDDDAIEIPLTEGLHGSLENRLVLDRHSERPRHARMVFGANRAKDQKAGPCRSVRTKIKEQVRYDQGTRRPVKDEVLPHARDPFQPQDLQLVAPRRGCWNEGLRRESDHFRKALWG